MTWMPEVTSRRPPSRDLTFNRSSSVFVTFDEGVIPLHQSDQNLRMCDSLSQVTEEQIVLLCQSALKGTSTLMYLLLSLFLVGKGYLRELCH